MMAAPRRRTKKPIGSATRSVKTTFTDASSGRSDADVFRLAVDAPGLIGAGAGRRYDLGLRANTDAGDQDPCEHSGVKAGRSVALTVGATAAVVLPVGLLVLGELLTPAGSSWSTFVGVMPELAAPGLAVAGAWVIVRHAPTNPTGPALAWTGGAIAFVTALDVLTVPESPAHRLPLAGAFATTTAGTWPLVLAGLLALLLVFPDGRARGRHWGTIPWLYAAATVLVVAAMWGARKADGRITGGPTAGPRLALLVC